jgi:2-dehydro-3-deoxygluconokinase
MLHRVAEFYPKLKLIATTLRTAQTATKNDWGAVALYEGKTLHVPQRPLEILDRVGGGDSFASGLIYGFLAGKAALWAVQCGVADGALARQHPETQAWPRSPRSRP